MKKIIIVFFIVIMIGCATAEYDTFSMRNTDFMKSTISLDSKGLSSEQIESILSTKLPEKFPINIATIFIETGYSQVKSKELLEYFIPRLKESEKIERIVPIPSYFIPAEVSFNSIQELGIRSLCEYVLVFIGNASTRFDWIKLFDGNYKVYSTVDYFIVDTQTTAILASDTLYSEIIYEDKLFENIEFTKAKEKLYKEQAEILTNNIKRLFSGQ